MSSSIGYGPSALTGNAPAPQAAFNAIPVFNGRAGDFDRFKFKVKHASQQVGLDIITFRTIEEFRQIVNSAPAVETREAAASARQCTKADLQAKNSQLAALLISRLSDEVTDHLRSALEESKHFDGAEVWHFLNVAYGGQTFKDTSVEGGILRCLHMRWNQREPLTFYLRRLNLVLTECLAARKIASSHSAGLVLESLVLRHVLDQLVLPDGSLVPKYQDIRKTYFHHLGTSSSTPFPEAGIFRAFMTEISSVDISVVASGKPKGSASASAPGFPPRAPSGASASAVAQKSSAANKGGNPRRRRVKNGGKVGTVKSVQSQNRDLSLDIQSTDDRDYGGEDTGEAEVLTAIVQASSRVSTQRQKAFLVDSGATDHCVRERSLFHTFRPVQTVVKLADGKTVVSTGKGEVHLAVETTAGRAIKLILTEALYTPTLSNNIFSTNKFASAHHGNIVEINAQQACLRRGSLVVPLRLDRNLLWLVHSAAKVPEPRPKGPEMTLQQFHVRMGHLNYQDCMQLAKQQGIRLVQTKQSLCEVCQSSKQRKEPIGKLAARPSAHPGRVIHCDIKGPIEDAAYNGSRFAIVFIDEATRYMITREMVSKDQCVKALADAIDEFARLPDNPIIVGKGSIFHSDSERVLQSKGMHAFLSSRMVTPRASPPHTHERNGIAERAIQTLFNTTRALLHQSGMPSKFWNVAMQHATYLRNRSPTDALGGISPQEKLTGHPPDLSQLRIFGAVAYVKVDEAHRTALSPKSRKGLYVGNSALSNSYRVMLHTGNRISFVDTVHCKIDEGISHRPSSPPPVTSTAPAPAALVAGKDPLLEDFSSDEVEEGSLSTLLTGDNNLPQTYSQAMSSTERHSWQQAVEKEISSLRDNGTFEYVPKAAAQGARILHSRWVFTKKLEADGSIRFKARLVARGDRQRAGIDYEEVYSPVVNPIVLRSMFAVAAVHNYDLDQMDAVTAFLNAPLQEDLYLHVPDGFQRRGDHVLKLKKSLYGLRQAPRYWNKTLHEWLLKQGLQQSKVDQCLYFIPNQLWLVFWVDDFLIMAANRKTKEAFKAAISKQFKMRDLGPINQFLGMKITRDRVQRTLTLSSAQHIASMLERFGMADAKPTMSPLPVKTVLKAATSSEELLTAQYPYRAVVGSLNYVACWTRPDIAFAVSQVARFQEKPTMRHWQAAKHILRYLKGTSSVALRFSASSTAGTGTVGDSRPSITGYVDASWGEDLDTRRSQSGYAFVYGGASIAWSTKLQTTVALSSTEAEYLALSSATREALFLRNVFSELCPADIPSSLPLYEDNQSTIKQALNLQSSARTKHIDVRHHFLKQHISEGRILLEYVPTDQQPADCLTKCLDRIKVASHRQTLLGSE
jgi:transposase InsO family protein